MNTRGCLSEHLLDGGKVERSRYAKQFFSGIIQSFKWGIYESIRNNHLWRMRRSFKKIFSECEILIHCYWVGIAITYVYKEFKTRRFYFICHMSQRNDYMDIFFRSHTSSTMDVGVYGRSSRPSICAWEHSCFSKGCFAVKRNKKKNSVTLE